MSYTSPSIPCLFAVLIAACTSPMNLITTSDGSFDSALADAGLDGNRNADGSDGASSIDTGLADSESSDTGLTDTGLSDTGLGDTGDAASPCTSNCIAQGNTDDRIGAANYGTCVINNAGEVWCWGSIGGVNRNEPERILGIGPAVQISAQEGGWHACARLEDGTVWCWGDNSRGQLGVGSTENSPTPVQVILERPAIDVSVSDDRSCAVDDRHRLWCWGLSLRDRTTNRLPAQATTAEDIHEFSSEPQGTQGACYRTSTGVRCFGVWGRGDGNLEPDFPFETETVGLTAAPVLIDSTYGSTCALSVTGEVFCWGIYTRPPGLYESTDIVTPIPNATWDQVTRATRTMRAAGRVQHLSVGSHHSICVCSESGRLFCGGTLGGNQTPATPTAFDLPDGSECRQVGTGLSHACAVSEHGQTFCWGTGAGMNGGVAQATPTLVPIG